MDSVASRAALRTLLRREGAVSIWLTANVVQAAPRSGRVVTIIRQRDEEFEALLRRTLSAFRAAAVADAA